MSEHLAVVVAGDDDTLHVNYVRPDSTSPSGWMPLGAPKGERLVAPTLVSTPKHGLEVFAFSTTHLGMWHRAQGAPLGQWTDWVRQPDPPGVTWDEGKIAVVRAADGRLQMFCVNASDRKPPLGQARNRLWHRQQTLTHGSWGRWTQHGQPPAAEEIFPMLEVNRDGRLELITGVNVGLPDERFEMWRLRQGVPNGPWRSWELATDPADPGQRYGPRSVCQGADGRLLAFGTLFGSGEVGQTTQGVPGGKWQPWVSLGNPGGLQVSAIAAVVDRNKRVHVLALAGTAAWQGPYRFWHLQQGQHHGSWSGWSELGAPVTGSGSSGDELVVASSASGLHVFTVGPDGALWTRGIPGGGAQRSRWHSLGRPQGTTQVFGLAVCTTG